MTYRFLMPGELSEYLTAKIRSLQISQDVKYITSVLEDTKNGISISELNIYQYLAIMRLDMNVNKIAVVMLMNMND